MLAYIGLGSNLGDRLEYLRRALGLMSAAQGVRVQRTSSVYRSAALGRTDQPEFLNLVAEVQTELEPEVLLARLQQIENSLGRTREVRWGPRTIDLDILYYKDRIIELPALRIPHPEIPRRAFVLAPLAELAPDLADPQTGLTVRQMLERLEGHGQRVARAGVLISGSAEGTSFPPIKQKDADPASSDGNRAS